MCTRVVGKVVLFREVSSIRGCPYRGVSTVLFCRQRALKALDERLSKTGTQPQTWPSMDETGSSQDEQDATPSSYPPPPPPSATATGVAAGPPERVVVEKIPGSVEGEGGPKPTNQPQNKTDSPT